MFEKIYARALRVVAPRFHAVYGEQAIQLVRDRWRDEQGVVSKVRLWLDLLADLAAAAIRDARFADQVLRSELAPPAAARSVPLFELMRPGRPRTSILVLGCAFSLGLLAMLHTLAGHGGRAKALSVPLLDGMQRSLPAGAIFQGVHIRDTKHFDQPQFFGSPNLSGPFGGGSPISDEVAVSADEKKRVLDGAITNLREYYVYPNVAREMINALLTHKKNGDYNKIIAGADFAELLTKQLQDVSHDRHLRVGYSVTETPDRPLGPPELDPNFRKMLEHDNCAFRTVEVLTHNIGYIKFDAFGPVSLCGNTAAAAMHFLAHVDALIFDLRENHGGDPHMVSFVASYLFDRPTHLNDIYTPRNKSKQEFWTAKDVPGPRFANTPVYVLTSGETFSGAEEFTYDLKNLKRAVIVGETTGGGAHLVMMHRIDAHFIIGVPFARPINPLSKTDWERTGVTPDVKVKSADALETAEQLASRKLGAQPQ